MDYHYSKPEYLQILCKIGEITGQQTVGHPVCGRGKKSFLPDEKAGQIVNHSFGRYHIRVKGNTSRKRRLYLKEQQHEP